MKVLPYEHRGKEYSQISVRSEEELRKAILQLRNEPDRWLRKIIAQKILLSDADFSMHLEELKEATTCQIM